MQAESVISCITIVPVCGILFLTNQFAFYRFTSFIVEYNVFYIFKCTAILSGEVCTVEALILSYCMQSVTNPLSIFKHIRIHSLFHETLCYVETVGSLYIDFANTLECSL